MTLNPLEIKKLSTKEEDEIKKKIDELAPWFHNIQLAEGIFTNPSTPESPQHSGTKYLERRWNFISRYIIGKIQNKTCLDIGCSSGFFSMKLIENQAKHVIGIDDGEQKLALSQAKFVAETLNVKNVDFEKLSVYDVEKLEKKFDLTLFMGVFYHLRHPLLALDKLRKVTDKMILQTVTTKIEDTSKKIENYFQMPSEMENIKLRSNLFYDPGYPKIHFIEHMLEGDKTNNWVPNLEAVTAMLRASGFHIDDLQTIDHGVIILCS